VITVYPAELIAWKQAQGQTIASLPRLSSLCTDIPSDEPLKIVSPNAATPYRLRRDTPVEYQQIPLTTQGLMSATHLYWYQDGTLIGSGAPEKKLLLPLRSGTHRLVVVDNTGRTDSLSYQVE
jgi:penicillin-binding protein 1C